ncbi:unnamed protein product [Linum tenue]|uniref:Uncharacterized protein n=2 Tax=Linum tenue TaxID=586396 RepID=A0AAV0LUX3_9ROSI|nr:unnamed protein product [Linum tenue]
MGIRSLLSSSVMVGARKIIMKGKRRNQQQNRHCQHSFQSPAAAKAEDHHRRRAAVPKGHIAVYLLGGDDHQQQQSRRFVVPISYVNHPMFGELLDMAEAEFGFNHPMGALTLPCDEDSFLHLISSPVLIRSVNR